MDQSRKPRISREHTLMSDKCNWTAVRTSYIWKPCFDGVGLTSCRTIADPCHSLHTLKAAQVPWGLTAVVPRLALHVLCRTAGWRTKLTLPALARQRQQWVQWLGVSRQCMRSLRLGEWEQACRREGVYREAGQEIARSWAGKKGTFWKLLTRVDPRILMRFWRWKHIPYSCVSHYIFLEKVMKEGRREWS